KRGYSPVPAMSGAGKYRLPHTAEPRAQEPTTDCSLNHQPRGNTMSMMSSMRDPITDLFFDGQNNDKGRFMLPANFPDPEPVNRVARQQFGVPAGLGIIIQAAKIKPYVGAMRLTRATPPVLLAPFQFGGDQADAYAACYWGSLLAKFLGLATARQYIVTHEA